MYVIGIDPHRGWQAAAVLDGNERVHAVLHLLADGHQRQRLIEWASQYTPRRWAVEGGNGDPARVAGPADVAAGEVVIDWPPRLAARVRLLDNDQSDKTDAHDARSTAVNRTRCAIAGCERSGSRTTPLCCDCSPSAITISSPLALRRCSKLHRAGRYARYNATARARLVANPWRSTWRRWPESAWKPRGSGTPCAVLAEDRPPSHVGAIRAEGSVHLLCTFGPSSPSKSRRPEQKPC